MGVSSAHVDVGHPRGVYVCESRCFTALDGCSDACRSLIWTGITTRAAGDRSYWPVLLYAEDKDECLMSGRHSGVVNDRMKSVSVVGRLSSNKTGPLSC